MGDLQAKQPIVRLCCCLGLANFKPLIHTTFTNNRLSIYFYALWWPLIQQTINMSNPTEPVHLLDLPIDILYLIFPYLDVSSFVALTATCKALHQADLAQYAPYWSSATRTTFRVPNQPVVENDGKRWQKMYRRLLTESRCFTWGSNKEGCLGHSSLSHSFRPPEPPRPTLRRRPVRPFRPGRSMHRSQVSWPTEIEETEPLGVIADMQCGYVARLRVY